MNRHGHRLAESGGGKRRGVWEKGHSPQERQHLKRALETTHILGRGAVKDTYNLLVEGIVRDFIAGVKGRGDLGVRVCVDHYRTANLCSNEPPHG